jgi:HSP20 family protein
MTMETQIQQKAERDLQPREKQSTHGETGTYEGRYFEPAVDIYETEDALVLSADLPGAKVEDIQTDIRDNQLTLTAKVPPTESKWKPVYQEYSVGHYLRQFRLGQQIDQTKITAELKDGVLTLVLPKVDTAKPRKIQIKTS